MAIANDIDSIYTHTKNAYKAIEALGGVLPNNKNLENLAAVIQALPVLPYNPANPTLAGLKAALDAGDYAAFPVGTEIPDTWNGESNPLIVGTYREVEGADNQTHMAVGLLRKYLNPTDYVWDANTTNPMYATSEIYTYLNGEYLRQCSAELQSLIGEVNVLWENVYETGLPLISVTGKWHLFSNPDVFGPTDEEEAEAIIPWEYWKNVTGLSEENPRPNAGRVKTDAQGTPHTWWLRSVSWPGPPHVAIISTNGVAGSAVLPVNRYRVLPFCYIFKD